MKSWIFTDGLAVWANESVGLSFEQSKLSAGIKLRHHATKITFRLFALQPPNDGVVFTSPTNLTLCGSSLRFVLPQSDSFPVQTEVASHVFETNAAIAGIDMVLSVGTQQLHAQSEIELCSRFGDAGRASPVCQENLASQAKGAWTLFRLDNTDYSYLEMLLPADFHSSQVSHDPGTGHGTLRHRLFSCSLEKGVILRAKLRGLLLPREGDEAAAAKFVDEFLASPPPLGR